MKWKKTSFKFKSQAQVQHNLKFKCVKMHENGKKKWFLFRFEKKHFFVLEFALNCPSLRENHGLFDDLY